MFLTATTFTNRLKSYTQVCHIMSIGVVIGYITGILHFFISYKTSQVSSDDILQAGIEKSISTVQLDLLLYSADSCRRSV